jgi:hypothetical protein
VQIPGKFGRVGAVVVFDRLQRLTYRYAGRDFRLTDVQGVIV